MSEVVDMSDYRPHSAGPVVCLRCGEVHVSVRPEGVNEVECHKCGCFRAVPAEHALKSVLGYLSRYCCGEKDSCGTCAAPACSGGDAMRVVSFIISAMDSGKI